MTGMHTFSTSNTPTITLLARRQASLPMQYRTDAYRAPPSPSSFRSNVGAHQSFECDHLAYCDFARERQQRAYELVHEQHALIFVRVNGRDSTLSDALLRDILNLGNWTNPPSALHLTVLTAACQRSHVRDRPHQRGMSPRGNLLTRYGRCLSCSLPIRSPNYWSLPSGTTPLMVSGDLVKTRNHPTSSNATSYGSSTTQVPPWSNSQNRLIRRPFTPLVALGASRLTSDPTRFKASYTANLPLLPPPVAPPFFSRLLRFAVSTPRIAMPTPRIAISTPRTAMSTPRTAISTPPSPCSPSPFLLPPQDCAVYTDECYVYTEDCYVYTSLPHYAVGVASKPTRHQFLDAWRVVNSD